ncbi:Oidioi.mRNA.OKI2018_I69.XSR.g13346.t1.cds [Oikopleura dioica]|uniref:Oidioi.mRNA.OKI2018_I69.XSR.g13346.t1.cds n=1 Tax=Oikopleura dioica TaxID=34765 RepID=A0ABN7S6L7_OIKDI|nr:Oidioi.mRNA.OKI2018_I69.XSR.g13346.t1.cds [Oikopleura dioica]
MSDCEEIEDGPPAHPATYQLPDIPFEEMNPLQKRWHKIKAIEEFPVKVTYLGDCEMPLEYVEYLSEEMRKQALEQAANKDIDIGGLEIKETEGKKKSQSRGGRGNIKAKKKAEPQNNEKADEIVIQGDFIDEVIDLILEKFGDKIPADMIEDIGDMKK